MNAWIARFQAAGIPCGPIHDVPEAASQRQVRALGLRQAAPGKDFSLTGLPLESRLPGYEVSYWTGMYLPAGAPQPVVDCLHDIFVKANASALMARQRETSMTEAFVMQPDEMVRFQAAESEKRGKIIRGAGIEPP